MFWIPANLALFALAMSMGFSDASTTARWLALIALLTVIASLVFLLARMIKKALVRA
jgi:hypothetical protein